MPTIHAAVRGKTLYSRGPDISGPEAVPEDIPPLATIFGTVSGQKLDVDAFGRTYGRPAAARRALLHLAAAAADSSLAEHASQHEHDDGTHTLSIVLCGNNVFVLPVLKSAPNQTAECRHMTWSRFLLDHPKAAAALERAIRRHQQQYPGDNIPDHVQRLYPEAAPL